MRRLPLPVPLASVFCLAVAALTAAPASEVPVTATFADVAGLRITSDGGSYADNEDCVRSWYNSQKGNYFLRTVSQTAPGCRDTGGVPGGDLEQARRVVLDFSDWVGAAPACVVSDGRGNTLDACGSQAVIDVRVIATEAVKAGAASTPVTIQFDLYPNFTEGAAFELTFLSRVPVAAQGATRVLNSTAAPAAQLSVRDLRRPSGRVTVGKYSMPFEVVLAPAP